jgi:hypothetical protein
MSFTDLPSSTQNNAEQSPLLQLPGELRNKIYDLVLSNKGYRLNGNGRAFNDRKKYSLALLRTCRQIQAEANIFPFILNTFSLRNANTISGFLDNRSNAPKAALIRHLNWTFTCYHEIVQPWGWLEARTEETPWIKDLCTWFSPTNFPALRELSVTFKHNVCTCHTAGFSDQDVDNVALTATSGVERTVLVELEAVKGNFEGGLEVARYRLLWGGGSLAV